MGARVVQVYQVPSGALLKKMPPCQQAPGQGKHKMPYDPWTTGALPINKGPVPRHACACNHGPYPKIRAD